MDKLEKHRILKTLDNPPRFLFWRMDEFLFMVVPFFLGVSIGSVFLMLSGLLLKPIYSKVVSKNVDYPIQAKAYWELPDAGFKVFGGKTKFPPSYQREILL